MSYVLDALRRAESERQRGSVPGLHAQNHVAPDADAPAATRPALWWPALLGLGALGLGGLAWWAWPASAPAPAPAPTPLTAAAQPVAPAPLVNLPAPPPAPAASRPVARAAPAPPPPAADAPAAASSRVPRLQDLPEPLRRQIPAMAFGGATHSPEASARMLIINGQIWHEGDEPAPGLTLERIALRGAQFRFRDQRFEVSF